MRGVRVVSVCSANRVLLVSRLCSKTKALQGAERELEQQRKQHHVAMDELLLQSQNLEQALKTERHVVTEEKWVSHTCTSASTHTHTHT